MPETHSAEAVDARGSPRSNVFLAAVLQVAGSSYPVRIRNLSSSGALVDGKDIPGEGDVVRVQRGPHSVVARIAWSKPGACGLRFASAVPVQEWIAYGSANKAQERVDEMIASVRAGAPAVELVDAPKGTATIDRAQAAEQLETVAKQLQEVAEDFPAIPGVVDQAMAALQCLDMARQKLVDLSATIGDGGC